MAHWHGTAKMMGGDGLGWDGMGHVRLDGLLHSFGHGHGHGIEWIYISTVHYILDEMR
jgi:hypothetical protein